MVSATGVVRLIHDGNTVSTGGFVGIGFAEEIAVALEARFMHPLFKTENTMKIRRRSIFPFR